MCSGCSLERLKFTGADLDYYLWALRTIFSGSSEIRTVFGIEAFLSLLLEVFFFFLSHQRGLIVSWKMGASLFKCFMFISELAPAAFYLLLPALLCYYHRGKKGFFMNALPFAASLFHHKLNTVSLKCLSNETVLCVNMSFSLPFLYYFAFFFYQRVSKKNLEVAHVKPVGRSLFCV